MKNGCEGAFGAPLRPRLKAGGGPDTAGCFPAGRVLPRRLVHGPVLPSVAAKETVPTSGEFRFQLSHNGRKTEGCFFLNRCQLNNSDGLESGDIMNYLDGPPHHHHHHSGDLNSCLPVPAPSHCSQDVKFRIPPQITNSIFISPRSSFLSFN